MAAALIDRLVHHCHIVNIRGNSFRMRHHTDLHRALGSTRQPTARDTPKPSRSRGKEATATYPPRTPPSVQFSPVKVRNSIPVLTDARRWARLHSPRGAVNAWCGRPDASDAPLPTM
jgi:hypothetical protein